MGDELSKARNFEGEENELELMKKWAEDNAKDWKEILDFQKEIEEVPEMELKLQRIEYLRDWYEKAEFIEIKMTY